MMRVRINRPQPYPLMANRGASLAPPWIPGTKTLRMNTISHCTWVWYLPFARQGVCGVTGLGVAANLCVPAVGGGRPKPGRAPKPCRQKPHEHQAPHRSEPEKSRELERRNSRLRPTQNQRMDVMRAFIGVDHFQVHQMPRHTKLIADAVATHHVARQAGNVQ